MEALVGFAIGYWTGTRDGREGLQKALNALDAITKSEQFKSLVNSGLSVGGNLLAKGMQNANAGGVASTVSRGVVGVVAQRAGKALVGGLRRAA
ncbi:MAG TPA: hypothetical protein VFW71_05330 [Actinomycetota bacterium]|nr:hypothetical protein [Actinomycetota bacterium]